MPPPGERRSTYPIADRCFYTYTDSDIPIRFRFQTLVQECMWYTVRMVAQNGQHISNSLHNTTVLSCCVVAVLSQHNNNTTTLSCCVVVYNHNTTTLICCVVVVLWQHNHNTTFSLAVSHLSLWCLVYHLYGKIRLEIKYSTFTFGFSYWYFLIYLSVVISRRGASF